MKNIIAATMIASTLLLFPQKSSGQDLSFQVFYSSLAPYGEWVTVSDYGMCWRPVGVPVGWRPYADGHWIWTEYGWTWVSDYDWGWAPFHYGRWAFDPQFGWIWIPGYVWAPAWVEWRWGGGYAGWAPMPPGFHFRVDVVVGPDYNDFGVGVGGWNFIHADEMGRPRYGYVGREAVPRVIGNTRNVTRFRFTSNGVYNTGLPREQVERATRHRIETVNVVRTTGTGRARVEGNRFFVHTPAPLAPRVRDEGQVIQREAVSMESNLRRIIRRRDKPHPECGQKKVLSRHTILINRFREKKIRRLISQSRKKITKGESEILTLKTTAAEEDIRPIHIPRAF
jgi:Family of unknown function (DUF6600)